MRRASFHRAVDVYRPNMPELPEFPKDRSKLIEYFDEKGAKRLPGVLGLEIVTIEEGKARLRCEVADKHMAVNGYLHAASVIALADTTAGYGCVGNLPEGAIGFTTVELKSNFIGTLLEGAMVAEGTLLHGGRTTQVWDVVVSVEETGRELAHFRCTELILYSRE